MSLNLATLLYLVASICFIQALKGLSHPTTSIRGNLFGMTGMAIAVLTDGRAHRQAVHRVQDRSPRIGLAGSCSASSVGGGYGAWRAKTVQMTGDARAGARSSTA
jgi:NAD(P) transhydrogenase subunit beta